MIFIVILRCACRRASVCTVSSYVQHAAVAAVCVYMCLCVKPTNSHAGIFSYVVVVVVVALTTTTTTMSALCSHQLLVCSPRPRGRSLRTAAAAAAAYIVKGRRATTPSSE